VGVGVAVLVGVGVGVLVGVDVGVAGTPTTRQAENSDVLLLGSVAEAVMNWPRGTGIGNVTTKLTLPLPSVVAGSEPRKLSPSP